jgi:Protein of unknown function (DUF1344)
MRKLIVPAVVSAAMAVSSLALAAEVSTGKITAIDAKMHTLTLDNGVVYHLAQGYKAPGLKEGEQVTVTWNMQAGEHMASAVKLSSY